VIPETRRPPELPGFDASLRLLVQRERYSLTDIGLMFGVSRERARQWCKARGIRYPEATVRGLHAIRVWDDAANRFVPVGRGVLAAQEKSVTRMNRKAAKRVDVARRRAEIVRIITGLRLRLKREPSWREMADALGFEGQARSTHAPYVLSHWPGRSHDTKTKMREFREETGSSARPTGGRGHVAPRSRTTHCSRGHERTPENTYVYTYGDGHVTRQCRDCKRERRRSA
jgi:hypothetical protein